MKRIKFCEYYFINGGIRLENKGINLKKMYYDLSSKQWYVFFRSVRDCINHNNTMNFESFTEASDKFKSIEL